MKLAREMEVGGAGAHADGRRGAALLCAQYEDDPVEQRGHAMEDLVAVQRLPRADEEQQQQFQDEVGGAANEYDGNNENGVNGADGEDGQYDEQGGAEEDDDEEEEDDGYDDLIELGRRIGDVEASAGPLRRRA